MEKRYLHKNGQIIWIDLTVSTVKDAKRKLKFFIGVIEDISERKQIEKAIHEEKTFTDNLLNALTDTFFVFDPVS